MKKIIILSVIAAKILANHAGSDWHLSAGLGKMYSLKETSGNGGSSYKLDGPSIIDLAVVYKNGLGVTYMAGSSSKLLYFSSNALGPVEAKDYKFKAYFGSYQRRINSVLQAKALLGFSNQVLDDHKNTEKLAYGGSLLYDFNFSKETCMFFEAGFLNQHNFESPSETLRTSGGFFKLGFARAI